jgi:hypothetical protein
MNNTEREQIYQKIIDRWARDRGGFDHCGVHGTVFKREMEPCWRCYDELVESGCYGEEIARWAEGLR